MKYSRKKCKNCTVGGAEKQENINKKENVQIYDAKTISCDNCDL